MYQVQLQDFEGPMDLLLYFIRRDELDIYDIPISDIANEFLEYVRVLEEIDLDGVGDFIYMAAVLINIKARMLLPADEVDDEGEPVDPRRELVERLLEYIRYKEATDSLEGRLEARSGFFTRDTVAPEASEFLKGQEVVLDVSVFDLVSALRRVLTEAEEEPVHEIRRFDYTVDEQLEYLRSSLINHSRRSFYELVRRRPKQFVIATFLAALELARQGTVRLQVSDNLMDFHLEVADASGEDDRSSSNT